MGPAHFASFGALASLALACLLPLQQLSTRRDGERPAPLPEHTRPAATRDVHLEMGRLLAEIERGLRAADHSLMDAGSGLDGSAQIAVAIRDAGARARRAVQDMDQLLELANHTDKAEGGT